MSQDKASSGTKTYARLMGYVSRYWLAFLVSVFGLVMHSFAEVAFVDLLGYITDTVGSMTGANSDLGELPSSGMTAAVANAWLGDMLIGNQWLIIPILLVVVSVMRGIGYLIGSYGLAYVASYLVHELRTEIMHKYLKLPFEFFDRSMSGHLVSVITFNVQQVTEAGTNAVKTLLQQGSLVIGLLAYLF